MQRPHFGKAILAVIATTLLYADLAQGTTIDLTTANSSGIINGARFFQYTESGSGSGNLDAFVRYQNASEDSTQGYNTDSSNFQYDEVSGSHTKSLKLNAVPRVRIDGVTYREFVFDLNETGGPNSDISLDEVEIYLASAGNFPDPANTNTHPFASATLVYDMDALADSAVLLEGDISGSGSGKVDMIMYVPDSLFVTTGNPFVYLYSKVGETIAQDSGFEEWAVSEEGGVIDGFGIAIPEPASILLASFALSMIGMRRSRTTS